MLLCSFPSAEVKKCQEAAIHAQTEKDKRTAKLVAAMPAPKEKKCKNYHEGMEEEPKLKVADEGEKDDWRPIHFTTTFKDKKLRARQGMIICLPSGVTKMEHVSLKVAPDGKVLEVKVAVPKAVSDPELFLKFCREDEDFGPSSELREVAFHEALSMERPSASAVVWKKFNIQLEFPCMEDIPLWKAHHYGGCNYIYLELFSQQKKTYMENNGRLSGEIIDLSHSE